MCSLVLVRNWLGILCRSVKSPKVSKSKVIFIIPIHTNILTYRLTYRVHREEKRKSLQVEMLFMHLDINMYINGERVGTNVSYVRAIELNDMQCKDPIALRSIQIITNKIGCLSKLSSKPSQIISEACKTICSRSVE
jgi:hypothetical protein